MKKKLLTTIAVCAAIATLAACSSDETTKDTTPTPTTVAAVQNESNTSEPATTEAPTQQTTTTAPTETTPEQITTEPTVEPLTWENSGLSYEVTETVNMAASRYNIETLYLVTVTNNHNDNTYHIKAGDTYGMYTTCDLTPDNTFEFVFGNKENVDTFVANITANPMNDLYVSIPDRSSNFLIAPETECTIISTEPYGNDKNITFNFDDTSWYFDKDNGMKVAIDEWYGTITTTALHFYDANDNLVGVYAEPIKNFYRYENDTITIRPDVDFTKITAITFGQY